MSDDRYNSTVHRDTEDGGDVSEWKPSIGGFRRSEFQKEVDDDTRERSRQPLALVLGVLGALLIVGGVVLRGEGSVLFALGGTGMFSGALLYYLSPEPLLSARVCTDTYSAFSRNERAIVQEFGLQDVQIYIPEPATSTPNRSGVRLFVPKSPDYCVPVELASDSLFVHPKTSAGYGIALYPSGTDLFRRFRNTATKKVANTPELLVEQLTEAITDQFELARSATATYEADRGRFVVEIDGNRLGPIDQFDHPTVSFIAIGLAKGLKRPIRADVETPDSETAGTSTVSLAPV